MTRDKLRISAHVRRRERRVFHFISTFLPSEIFLRQEMRLTFELNLQRHLRQAAA